MSIRGLIRIGFLEMKGLKLFTLSIGLITSFGVCNSAFSDALDDCYKEFYAIQESADTASDNDDIFECRKQLGKLRNKVQDIFEELKESQQSTEQVKALSRELNEYDIKLTKEYMGY